MPSDYISISHYNKRQKSSINVTRLFSQISSALFFASIILSTSTPSDFRFLRTEMTQTTVPHAQFTLKEKPVIKPPPATSLRNTTKLTKPNLRDDYSPQKSKVLDPNHLLHHTLKILWEATDGNHNSRDASVKNWISSVSYSKWNQEELH